MLWVHIKFKESTTKYGLHNGMTLIEVIISIALMSILVLGILTALTNQVSLLNKSKEITMNSFTNQGEVENVIEEVKSNTKFTNLSTWRTVLNDYAVVHNRKDSVVIEGDIGKKVELYKVELKDIKGKTTRVFLSPSLANDEKYTITLEAKEVDILVDSDKTKTVALISGSSTPMVTGRYTIDGTNYYASVCKWYASIPGVINPQWPHDYEQITRKVQESGLKPNYGTLNFQDLKNYANRYIVFSAQPADGNGIRGAEVVSKSVLILGSEWRDGNLPWVDKNGNNFFDGFAKDKDVQLQYSMINGAIDYKTLEISISDVEKTDIKKGTLFVPRSIDGRNDYTKNDYEKDIITNNTIDWKIEHGIHFSNKIITSNPVSLKTENGQIVMYRFVELDTTGKAILDSGGYRLKNPGTFSFEDVYSVTPRIYQNLGSEISSLNDVYLGAYGTGKGFIYLQPFSSINGANILLEAEEPINIFNSSLSLEELIGDESSFNREIVLASIKNILIKSIDGYTSNYIKGNPKTKSTIIFNTNQNILIENTKFKDIDISLLGNSNLKDVEWDENKILSIADGKNVTFTKGLKGKVGNNGILNLGNTGGITLIGFVDNNDGFDNPIGINISSSDNDLSLSTIGYFRNISYANPISNKVLTQDYSPIGQGNTNLEIRVEGIEGLSYSFDGENKITLIPPQGILEAMPVTISIRDRYAPSIESNITIDSASL